MRKRAGKGSIIAMTTGTNGTLYIVSAASGAGKTSLLRALMARDSGLTISVSHTTRTPRPAEVDGQDYHFVDENTFQQLISADAFLEHAQVFDRRYGTTHAAVQADLAAGLDVLVEIDWQGARQIRERLSDTVSVFILPPSQNALESRLRARGQDSDAVIAERMQAAISEMSHCSEYDYWVWNDDFDEALADLEAIIRARRLRRARQGKVHAREVNELTGL
jgi:guanylate kinase